MAFPKDDVEAHLADMGEDYCPEDDLRVDEGTSYFAPGKRGGKLRTGIMDTNGSVMAVVEEAGFRQLLDQNN